MDKLAIKTLKINSIGAIEAANSGHPGIALGAATMMHTLFTKHLVFDPKNPNFINRDRFILSSGHGSSLLYSTLRILGLIEEEDLKNFRKLGSKTPGHPEYKWTKGVEATTGPLGQGVAMAVGMAIAEENLRARFNEINHYTYVIVGDGDLQEGIANEALQFAGYQNLSKLIVLHDSNDIQLDTKVSMVSNLDRKKLMESIGFDYQLVKKNTVNEIDKAITKAKTSNKPSFIEIKTTIGEDAEGEGTSAVHGAPLGKEKFNKLKEKLNWNEDDFYLPLEVKTLYEKTIFTRGNNAFLKFKMSSKLKSFLKEKSVKIKLSLEKDIATRATSGKVIEYLNKKEGRWIGGSADLSASTKAAGGDGIFNISNRKGRNILFGVREFAMGAIANGIALHSNFKPFVSTFFVFSDYMKPSIRMAGLMSLPMTFIFTHDSVYVGEDGPTHEPIEHIATMRSIPNVTFIRPADEKEVIGAYERALNSEKSPTVIALTRQNIKSLKETSKDKVQSGIYKLHQGSSGWTLVASGSELSNALEIGVELNMNVYSISNATGNIEWDITKAISIEAATTYGLGKFALYNIGIDTFGESGDGNEVYAKLGLDKNSLRKKIIKIMQ